ncbi:hypothetical protein HPB48_025968 [Haemaphysalis longicornis]|uniref:E2 NEDD8-conjugating enzyme n=1 Tax=Haemaphysalis longicornis TaxID=44386 RepID=A0A9J6GZW3_HAELO|nr:hypothetical protein HPB48_025968 [Haemaphysalis longicornis]
MLKLFALKREQHKSRQAASNAVAASRVSSARLRIAKDISDLSLGDGCEVQFPDPDDLLAFKVVICPDEGFYKGGRFEFSFRVGPDYPHEPPRVRCDTAVYHPNIDLEGNVCLNYPAPRVEPRAQRGLARVQPAAPLRGAEPGGSAQQGGGRHAGHGQPALCQHGQAGHARGNGRRQAVPEAPARGPRVLSLSVRNKIK